MRQDDAKSANQMINEFLHESACKRAAAEVEEREAEKADALDCWRPDCAEHRRDWTNATAAEIEAELRRRGVHHAR